MLKLVDFTPRAYQENILKTCLNNNTLVILPTGIGKTAISMLLALDRLNKFPGSKVVFCSPTKPLSDQHVKSFKKYTNIDPEEIILFTGQTNPIQRKEIWKNAKVIVATPQTIESDLKNSRISLEKTSLLVLDEAHRSKGRYAHTLVAQRYMEQSENPRIIGLTASPGSTKEKINEIRSNLFIEAIEIRTEDDEDVKPYIQERETDWIYIKLPSNFLEVQAAIKRALKPRYESLRKYGITKPATLINKTDLLKYQQEFSRKINQGDKKYFWAISIVAQALKLEYALELIETQSPFSLKQFWYKISKDQTKAGNSIREDRHAKKAIKLTDELIENGENHPKLDKLIEVIKEEFSSGQEKRIIIFANYRNMIDEIVRTLKKIPGINPVKLVGQKEGITQKKQIETIKEFGEGMHNILVTSSVGEEGLDIPEVTSVIFYEPIVSELRRIQRAGRTARLSKGKIMFLVTKNTKDEAYYWISYKREKKMKSILQTMQKEKQSDLTSFKR